MSCFKAETANNRRIYDEFYSRTNLFLQPNCGYDRYLIELRQKSILKYGQAKNILDLCCGSGEYLIPVIDKVNLAVGLDFSEKMLEGLKENIRERLVADPENLYVIQADAASIPLQDQSLDTVFSYTSLYYLPDLEKALKEMHRVLRPGGYGIFEVGNLNSLATIVNRYMHRKYNWAKTFNLPYSRLKRLLGEIGFEAVEHRCFQILPMVGSPRIFYLLPFLLPHWKRILGLKIGNKILDEWISGAPILRNFAYRHFFVVKKHERPN